MGKVVKNWKINFPLGPIKGLIEQRRSVYLSYTAVHQFAELCFKVLPHPTYLAL